MLQLIAEVNDKDSRHLICREVAIHSVEKACAGNRATWCSFVQYRVGESAFATDCAPGADCETAELAFAAAS